MKTTTEQPQQSKQPYFTPSLQDLGDLKSKTLTGGNVLEAGDNGSAN